jgi:hypothetical protein
LTNDCASAVGQLGALSSRAMSLTPPSPPRCRHGPRRLASPFEWSIPRQLHQPRCEARAPPPCCDGARPHLENAVDGVSDAQGKSSSPPSPKCLSSPHVGLSVQCKMQRRSPTRSALDSLRSGPDRPSAARRKTTPQSSSELELITPAYSSTPSCSAVGLV